jgi:hypothetical protein
MRATYPANLNLLDLVNLIRYKSAVRLIGNAMCETANNTPSRYLPTISFCMVCGKPDRTEFELQFLQFTAHDHHVNNVTSRCTWACFQGDATSPVSSSALTKLLLFLPLAIVVAVPSNNRSIDTPCDLLPVIRSWRAYYGHCMTIITATLKKQMRSLRKHLCSLIEKQHAGEPGYNNIGLCDTSSIASNTLLYQLIPHC